MSFGMFNIMFFLVFAIVISIFIIAFVSSVKTWNRNNHSPRLTVVATVVAKRMDVSHHNHGTDHMHHSTFTTYYVTFEVESKDRMELCVNGHEYGMLVEGDVGMLSFQGTRYLGFERA